MRLSASGIVVVAALAALAALAITDQVVPADSARAAELRPWLVARATGVTAYLLLVAQVGLGLVLSHPTNLSTWKVSKHLFPWHEYLTVFTWAFLALHVGLLAVDRFADVGVLGALVPGMSGYRPAAVGIGTVALYALLLTAVTARWTRLLPAGAWLSLHRLAAVAFFAAWIHSVLAGTDSGALEPLYLGTGLPILAGVAHRWWVRRTRPVPPATVRELLDGRAPASEPSHSPLSEVAR